MSLEKTGGAYEVVCSDYGFVDNNSEQSYRRLSAFRETCYLHFSSDDEGSTLPITVTIQR